MTLCDPLENPDLEVKIQFNFGHSWCIQFPNEVNK